MKIIPQLQQKKTTEEKLKSNPRTIQRIQQICDTITLIEKLINNLSGK
jgi:hypothetical protein